ncbi:fructoselysine-6-P-deglycase FrlB-like protein [Nakamurella sp. UYEF19]|uniref:SIS domain-containing protein n=1 Tax=Nakamurella sp. UYEF19 TaxID=1756392 RepID=UPI00339B5B5F
MSITPQTATERELFSQPDIWLRVISESAAHAVILPKAGVPVLFVGCGTSYYIGESYARLRNAAGLGRTRAVIASEIPYVDEGETVVVLSRSGTTGDVNRVARELGAGHRIVGIIGDPETPLPQLCDEYILLDYADEVSVVQTRFATSALTALRASLGQNLSGLVEDARTALADPVPEPLPDHVVFLGHGWTVGVAQEAALKCREAAGMWTEAYAVMEYQHGPIAAAGPGSLIWSFDPLPDFVAEAVLGTGAALHVPTVDPQAQLATVHRLAVALAGRAGRDPDHPHFLSRSVQLD